MSSASSTPTANRRNSSNPSSSTPAIGKNRSPTRPQTPSAMPANGPDRTRSVKTTPSNAATARSAARKPASKDGKVREDEDARAETSALIEDMREQLRKTEAASDEYQKQLQVLQSKLDEAMSEQTRLEETASHHAETIASLEVQLHETKRSTNDLQSQLEHEQTTSNSEREAASTREGELNDVITRLKESMAQRESRKSMSAEGSLSRAASLRGRSSPNPERSRGPVPLERRDSSQNSSQLILQKDKVIEDLRLELAEAHLKVMEVDRAGGGRLQALEKQLLETRMSNAKLMEDNESYQFLLQEKTLTGDMASKFHLAPSADQQQPSSRAPSRDAMNGNLADELETVGEEDESGADRKKLEQELAAQKDQNKALTLYINRIIGKLLANEKFEVLFENGSVTGDNPLNAQAKASGTADKDLPPTPGADGDVTKENTAPSLLQRAGSIFGGPKRPRPRSFQPPQAQGQGQGPVSAGLDTDTRASIDQSRPPPTAVAASTEDPGLAPRVPLQRGSSVRHSANPRGPGHRRTTSEISNHTTSATGAFTTRTPSGTLSPPLQPGSKRSSVQQTQVPTQMAEQLASPDLGSAPMPSPSLQPGFDGADLRPTSTSSATPSDSGYGDSIAASSMPPSSPPRSVAASSTEGQRASGGAATMSGGKQMRPLRLVQEKKEADAERKKANRGSWMGWFNKGPLQGQGGPGAAGVVGQGLGQQGQVRPGSQEGR